MCRFLASYLFAVFSLPNEFGFGFSQKFSDCFYIFIDNGRKQYIDISNNTTKIVALTPSTEPRPHTSKRQYHLTIK